MGIRRSIMGFDQEEVLKLKKTITKEVRGVEKQVEIKLDLQDLLILKQIADFPNRKAITKVIIQDEIFFWVSYKQLIEELPILDIGKQALSDRLDKMSKLGLLKRTFQTIGGNSNMTFFKMGDAYEGLRYKKDEKQSEEYKEDGYRSQTRDGIVSEYDTCRSQLRDINISVNKESVLELVNKEEKDKSFSKKDDFSALAAEPQSEYETPKKKRKVTPKDDALFEECWKAYDRKGHKNKAKPYWDKLPQDVRERIMPHIKAYVSVRERSYQQDFERYLKDKTYDTVVYDRNTLIYDPERITNKDEYRPVESLYLSWDERSQCYVTCSNIEMLCDGYTDENRPNGAKVKKNGYTFVWDSSIKQWVNKQ